MMVSGRLGIFFLSCLVSVAHVFAIRLPDVSDLVPPAAMVVAQGASEVDQSDQGLYEEEEDEFLIEEDDEPESEPSEEQSPSDQPESSSEDMDEFLDDLDDERGFLFEAGERQESPAEETAPAVSSSPDSSEVEEPIVVEEEELVEEGEGELVEEAAPSEEPQKVADEVVREKADVVNIEEERAVNFAEGLREYRSPKLAVLLSLVVPGLGQAYAKNYWKTGVFVAAEIAAIATSVGFRRRGNHFAEQAYNHADSTYSYERFKNAYDTLYAALLEKKNQSGVSLEERKAYADSMINTYFYGQHQVFGDTTNNPEVARTGFDHKYFKNSFGEKEFYSWIESDLFVHGWEDSKPRPTPEDIVDGPSSPFVSGDTLFQSTRITDDSLYYKFNAVPIRVNGSDTSYGEPMNSDPAYGFSHFYQTYKGLLDQRTDQHRIAQNILYVVILNHIVSAIDAGITAKNHNDMLLGRKSFWQRIELEQNFVNTGTETVPGMAIRLGF